MIHWPILPLLIPAIGAPIVLLIPSLQAQRVAAMIALAATSLAALYLLILAGSGDRMVYALGAWPAPFGIVIVADRLSALMVALGSLIGLAAMGHAIATGWDRSGRHIPALILLQMFGINGAFLTGDAFNLFVFFEVMLIASYALLGQGAARAGFGYAVLNLAASALFLIALGTLYAVTGTLNMADLARRAAVLAPGDQALFRVGAILLFMVFALKAALVPLQLWLPEAYGAAPGPAAALFTLLTKVGTYAILRMGGLFAPAEAASDLLIWLMPVGALTLILGMAGVVGAGRLGRLAAFAVLGSTGTMALALGMGGPDAAGGAVFYMVHSTVAAALLFLIASHVAMRRGDRITPAARLGAPEASLFFIAAIAMAGLPPLSGFPAKLLILAPTQGSAVAWTAVLAGTFLAVIGYARAGSTLFWAKGPGTPSDAPRGALVVPWMLAGALVLLSVLAGPVARLTQATAEQALDRAGYIAAVLGGTP